MTQADNLPRVGSVWGVPGEPGEPETWMRICLLHWSQVYLRSFSGSAPVVPYENWPRWLAETGAVDITAIVAKGVRHDAG